jgi:hypothetical protein
VAVAIALFTLAWRFLTFAGFNNDHHVDLARSQQMLLGEWPDWDFVDPGMPLMYAVSAVAWLVGGRALGTELTVVAGALAIGAALMAIAAARLSSSAAIATFVAVLGVLIHPRSYAYPKVLLYAAMAAILARPAVTVSARRVVALALLTAMGFLFRHDHGLFLGIGSAAFLLLQGDASGSDTKARNVALFAATLAIALAPWAIFISFGSGLGPYFQSAVAFSRVEAHATVLRELPRLEWNAGLSTADNAFTVLYYVFHVLPVGCLGMAVWRRVRHQEAWPGETSAVMAISLMAIPLNLSFLRNLLSARVPDAFVPAGLLGAWVLGLAFGAARWSPARVAAAAAAGVVAAAISGAVILGAGVREQGSRAGLQDPAKYLMPRVQNLLARLAKEMPEGDQIPSRQAGALMPFMAFLQRCTAPTDRLLVTGLRPEIYVLANRGFAGGHVSYAPGYYGDVKEQTLTVSRLRRQSVPFVLRLQEIEPGLHRDLPLVAAYLDEHYAPLAYIEVPEALGIHVYLERGRRAASVDPATGWPCHPVRASAPGAATPGSA